MATKEKNTSETAVSTDSVKAPDSELLAKLNEIIAINEKLREENESLKETAKEKAQTAGSDTVDEVKQAAIDRMHEKVPVKLFKDNGKYKDDLVVQLAGVAYQIKRGITVEVPRAIYDIIRRSELQDQHTANMLETLQEEYAKQNSSN